MFDAKFAELCLVVDPRGMSSDDAAQLNRVKAVVDVNERLAALLDWQPMLRDCGVMAAIVKAGSPYLHVAFRSFDSLVAAQRAVRCLCRCCALHTGSERLAACGPLRHHMPEMLCFTCGPCPELDGSLQLRAAALELMRAMDLDHTAIWITTRKDNQQSVQINVLPRIADLSALAAMVHGLHLAHSLAGNPVAVEGPNTPELRRCSCGQMGHAAADCPLYRGLAVRLLFEIPQSVVQRMRLVERLGARAGFLGSDLQVQEATRVVTLLFGTLPAEEMSKEELALLLRRLAEFAAPLLTSGDLVEYPRPVKVETRGSECTGCGHIGHQHQCRFINQKATYAQHARSMQPQARNGRAHGSAQHAGAAEAGAQARPAAAPWVDDGMCRRWRRRKACHVQGCERKHPADHVPRPPLRCFDFDKGKCTRPVCKFPHRAPASSVAAAAAAQPAAEAAASPAAAASSSAAPAVAASVSVAAAATAASSGGSQAMQHDDGAEEKKSEPAAAVVAPVHRPAVAAAAASVAASAADAVFTVNERPRTKGRQRNRGSSAGRSKEVPASKRTAGLATVNSFALLQSSGDECAPAAATAAPRAASPARRPKEASAGKSTAGLATVNSFALLQSSGDESASAAAAAAAAPRAATPVRALSSLASLPSPSKPPPPPPRPITVQPPTAASAEAAATAIAAVDSEQLSKKKRRAADLVNKAEASSGRAAVVLSRSDSLGRKSKKVAVAAAVSSSSAAAAAAVASSSSNASSAAPMDDVFESPPRGAGSAASL